jgi:signal transduction histidine kinase
MERHHAVERGHRNSRPQERRSGSAMLSQTAEQLEQLEERRRQIVADPARLAALHATGLLESEGQETLDQLAALTARTLRVPLAQVNLITADAQVPIAAAAPLDPEPQRWQLPVGLDSSFCQHVLGRDEPLVIEDARVHPLVATNRATTEAGIVAYAAAPVFAASGEPLGTVCIVDFEPRAWTAEEIGTLSQFASLASSDVALVTTATMALGAADRELAARGERLEAERAHLLAVIEQMPLGVAVAAAPSGGLVLHNAEAVRILRHPMLDAGDVSGYVQYGAHHADGTAYAPAEYPIARAALHGETVTQHIMPYRRGDGTDTVLAVNAAPVFDGAGDIVAAVSTFEDISARIAADAALREARDEAAAALLVADQHRLAADLANQAKSDFLATMSHEMRTPLNAIVGYAELMTLGVAGALTPQQREYLERQRASSNHLLQLVNDLLDQAKEGSGELTVAQDRLALDDAIRAAIDFTRPQAAARGVQLMDSCESPDQREGRERSTADAPSSFRYIGDEHRVRQILLNVLSNAVKFTDAGGNVTLTCGGATEAPADLHAARSGPWVYVRVTDTGIGIPEAEQTKVFEPFHQVLRPGSTVHTRTEGGTGLGLPISRRLARLMGGDLVLESQPDVGSTLTLWLPAAEPASASKHATKHATSGGDGMDKAVAAQAAAGQARASARVVIPSIGLLAVGERLRASSTEVMAAYVERLRADPAIPSGTMPQATLEDHAASLLADLAQSLIIAAEGGPDAPALLHDGGSIQRAIAEYHGVRRFHQGWSMEAVRRDFALLRESMVEILRPDSADDAPGSDPTDALGLLLSMLERAEHVSERTWRLAQQTRAGSHSFEATR